VPPVFAATCPSSKSLIESSPVSRQKGEHSTRSLQCLHGVPGAAFVIVRREALKSAVSRTYYLDLRRLAEMQDQRGTPFTPSVHAYYALVEALREYEDQGGRRGRHERYAALAEHVRQGSHGFGIATILPPAESSVVLRAYQLPAGVSYSTVHDAVKAEGFVIYAGQGELSKSLFRISTMGAVTMEDMDRLTRCFGRL